MKLIIASLAVIASIFGSPVDDINQLKPPMVAEVYSDIEPRITGGDLAEPGQFPFQADIRITACPNHSNDTKCGNYLCAATLITDQLLITAAHCLLHMNGENVPMEATSIVVRLGSTRRYQGEEIETKCFKFHKNWDPKLFTMGNDIGIIYLPYSIKKLKGYSLGYFDHNIFLPNNKEDYANENAIASGFGRTGDKNEQNVKLHYVEMKVLSNSECNKIHYGIINFSDSLMCTSSVNGATCNGDSGGPLFVQKKDKKGKKKNTLIGVTSFGVPYCGPKSTPPVFTRVSHFLKFIDDNIIATSNAKSGQCKLKN